MCWRLNFCCVISPKPYRIFPTFSNLELLGLKAVGYRRGSMREQIDGHSLDAQEKNIRDYAASQGWDQIEIYTDAGISAKKDSHRPDLERLMRDAEA